MMNKEESKKQILKSTGILGSVQVVNILIGIIRIKVLAILLGPLGVGIAGIYVNTVMLINSATGLGLNFSGVRDISAAAATNDQTNISKTILVLRRWSWFTGLMGMVLTLIFSKPLSRLAFGNEEYATGLAILSVTLLLSSLTGSMQALLQGMRRVSEVAKANLAGAVIGLVGSVTVYYYWGVKGIVPALLLTFLSIQLSLWYYSRNINTTKVALSLKETFVLGRSMAKLGFFMVVAALFGSGILYVVRAFIVQRGGIESIGHFVAAWTITTMYMSAIFKAMGTDFYPRLSGIQSDDTAVTKLVNEQTEVALLLTMPIIIGMLSFVKVVVSILYSDDFKATTNILNWQLLGDFFKVLGWPMGYILLAKAKGKFYVFTELVWNFIFLGIVYLGWQYWGIQTAGIAFLIAYILNLLVIFIAVKKMIGFKWTAAVVRHISFFFPLLILSGLNSLLFSQQWQQYVFGSVLTIGAAWFSLTHIRRIIDLEEVVKKFKMKLQPSRSGC